MLWWFGKVLFAFYVLFVVIGVLRGCDGNERADCWLYKSFGWSLESIIQGASTLIVSIQFHTYALYFTVIWIGNAAIRDHNFDQFPGTQCTDLCLCQDLGSLRQQIGHLVGFNLRIWPTNKQKTLVDFRWQVEFLDIQETALHLQPQNISDRKNGDSFGVSYRNRFYVSHWIKVQRACELSRLDRDLVTLGCGSWNRGDGLVERMETMETVGEMNGRWYIIYGGH